MMSFGKFVLMCLMGGVILIAGCTDNPGTGSTSGGSSNSSSSSTGGASASLGATSLLESSSTVAMSSSRRASSARQSSSLPRSSSVIAASSTSVMPVSSDMGSSSAPQSSSMTASSRTMQADAGQADAGPTDPKCTVGRWSYFSFDNDAGYKSQMNPGETATAHLTLVGCKAAVLHQARTYFVFMQEQNQNPQVESDPTGVVLSNGRWAIQNIRLFPRFGPVPQTQTSTASMGTPDAEAYYRFESRDISMQSIQISPGSRYPMTFMYDLETNPQLAASQTMTLGVDATIREDGGLTATQAAEFGLFPLTRIVPPDAGPMPDAAIADSGLMTDAGPPDASTGMSDAG